MKFNIANPATGAQKRIEIDDERKLRALYDKRIAQEVEGDALGDEFKGYIFKITGGNDKQGFPMMQGVLLNTRVKLLLGKNHSCYRPRKDGERKKKSVRGCIVGPDIAALNLVILKKGEDELPGLTDVTLPRRLGPKRASKIRKLFRLSKKDDVRKYVLTYRREIPPKEGKEQKRKRFKSPKIQRLVTSVRLQRKRRLLTLKKNRIAKSKADAAEYAKLLTQRNREKLVKQSERISKLSRKSAVKTSERTSSRVSTKTSEGPKTAAKGAKKAAKKGAKPTTEGPKKTITKKKTAKTAEKTSGKKSEKTSAKSDKAAGSKKTDKTTKAPSKVATKPKSAPAPKTSEKKSEKTSEKSKAKTASKKKTAKKA